MKKYWTEKFDTVKAGASEKLEEVKTTITGKWNGVKNWFGTTVAPKFTKQYWKDKFNSIKTGASERLDETRTAITTKWNGVKTWFNASVAPKFTTAYWKGKFNTVADGAKAAFNSVISIVEKAVNAIINKINTLSWKIPDWVPSYGGKSFGFSIKQISIPRLATGGIVTESTLANIGERGAEAVLPLTGSQGAAWMDALSTMIATKIAGNEQTKVVLQVGETELGWATIGAINNITKQAGGLQLAL